MKTTYRKGLLMRFLKENRCLTTFKKEMKEYRPETKIDYYITFYKGDQFKSLFLGAFGWEESEKGFKFWSELDDKWGKFLKTNGYGM